MHLILKLSLGMGLLFGCLAPVPIPSVGPTASVPLLPPTHVTPSPVLSSVVPTPTPLATPTLLNDGVTVLLDLNQQKGYQDGPLAQAKFGDMGGMAFDARGNLYFSDNFRIRKITPEGLVITVAGTGIKGDKDGSATQAQIGGTSRFVFDSVGNLWFLDLSTKKLRRLNLHGNVETYHWMDQYGHRHDRFPYPVDVEIDRLGNISILNAGNSDTYVYRLNPQGALVEQVTVADNPTDCGWYNGGLYQCLEAPRSFGRDTNGNLYVFMADIRMIMRINADEQNKLTPLAGSANRPRINDINGRFPASDGFGFSATFLDVFDFAYSPKRNAFYLSEVRDNRCIRALTTEGMVKSLTTCSFGSSQSQFDPQAITLHPSEDVLYIRDRGDSDNRLLKLSLTDKPVWEYKP